MSYRLIAGAEADIDRILLESARRWGIEAATRYDLLMRTVFAIVGYSPEHPASQAIETVPGIRIYPLRLARYHVTPEHRVRRPRHIVVYRLGTDDIVEIIGLAHDRMLLGRAARRMQRNAGA